MDSLQQVMSQIASVRWQESEKLRDASNFSIWASVLHLKAAQYGGIVQGYIKSGVLLCADIETEKVTIALDTICHTLVTGGLVPEVLEEVLYNGWYGREVIVQLDKLYGSIGVEAAMMLVRSLTSGDWRKLISSRRDYNKFFNEFLNNVLKTYTPDQLAALFYAASILDNNYRERVFNHFAVPAKITFTDAKVLANHLGDDQFGAGKSSAAFVSVDGAASKRKKKRGSLRCYRCNAKGHTSANCMAPKPVKSPAEDESLPTSAWMAYSLNAQSDVQLDQSKFYFDSGASQHICTNASWFINVDELKSTITGIGNAKVAVTGEGSVRFNNGQLLEKVLLAPEAANLISISAATKKGARFVFSDDNIFVGSKIVGKRVSNGLYECLFSVGPVALVSFNIHDRLGHPGAPVEEMAARHYGISNQKHPECSSCLRTKQARVINKVSTRSATDVLGLVHVDIVGPFADIAVDGSRYYLTLVDDFSRYLLVTPISSRSMAVNRLIFQLKHFSNALGKKVIIIRSDNEFSCKVLNNYCDDAGIKHEMSVPYESHQNGLVERWQRTITTKARSLLSNGSVPDELWNEAVKCAAYLLNLTPRKYQSISSTPYEIFTGRKASINHLKTFGCAAYAIIPKPLRHNKLADTSLLCCFVGYDEERKAYRVYNPHNGTVVVTSQCRFDEQKFPFTETQFKDIMVTSAPSVGITPGSYAVKRATPPLNNDNVNEVTDDKPETEIIDMCSSSEDEVSDTDSVALVAEEESHKANETSNQEEEQNSSDDDEDAELKLVSSTDRKRSHDLDEDEVDQIQKWYTNTVRETVKPRSVMFCLLSAFVAATTESPTLDDPKWRKACLIELEAIVENKTFLLVELPAGKRAVGCRWVFTMKSGPDGPFEKARLVAQGFSQIKGIDYGETFSPVIRYESVRILLAVAASKSYMVHQMDVSTAFLHGDIDKEVFMKQPPGFADDKNPSLVWKLHKSLYGLKQSPRCWYIKMVEALQEFGFERTAPEHGVFFVKSKESECLLGLYVDDLIIAGSSSSIISKVKLFLSSRFKMKDLGKILGKFLGLDIAQDATSIKLSMDSYIAQMVRNFKMEDSHTQSTPMMVNPYNQMVSDASDKLDEVEASLYRSIIGTLLFAANCLRFDICFAVGLLSRFLQNPEKNHLSAANRSLRYLNSNPLTINYDSSTNVNFAGYSDSDWAGDIADRKSVGGYMFLINGKPITWSSKKQVSVSLLSCEAEYIGLTEAAKEVLFIQQVFNDINVHIGCPVIYCDNNSAVNLAKHPTNHRNSKHIDIRYHFIREHVGSTFDLWRVDSSSNLADILTKSLASPPFQNLMKLIGC